MTDKEDEEAGKVRPSRSSIDDNLRRVYDDLIDESVPDRFSTLLEKLREQDAGKGTRG